MQAGLGKEFLDLVQRLPSEVRRSQHFGFGLLHQFADLFASFFTQFADRTVNSSSSTRSSILPACCDTSSIFGGGHSGVATPT